MYVQDHVGGTVSDGSIGVRVEVIEKLVDFNLRVFCRRCLFGGNTAEGDEGGHVDRAGVV